MKHANIYFCHTATEARQRADLFYIQVNNARQIEKENNTIKILSGKGTILAIFNY